jgi:hypothetical protein
MADSCTSKTGTVTGTNPNFVVTYKTNSSKKVIAYVKYTKNTDNLTLTFDVINPSLNATDQYHVTVIAADATTSVQTVSLTSTGNVRVPIEIDCSDKTVICNATFASGAGTSTAVVEFGEE